jgi:hypothetical protein
MSEARIYAADDSNQQAAHHQRSAPKHQGRTGGIEIDPNYLIHKTHLAINSCVPTEIPTISRQILPFSIERRWPQSMPAHW